MTTATINLMKTTKNATIADMTPGTQLFHFAHNGKTSELYSAGIVKEVVELYRLPTGFRGMTRGFYKVILCGKSEPIYLDGQKLLYVRK